MAILRTHVFNTLQNEESYRQYDIYEDEKKSNNYDNFRTMIENFIYDYKLQHYLSKIRDIEFKDIVESIYGSINDEIIQNLKESYFEILKNKIFKKEFTEEIKKIADSYITALLSENPRKELRKFLNKFD